MEIGDRVELIDLDGYFEEPERGLAVGNFGRVVEVDDLQARVIFDKYPNNFHGGWMFLKSQLRCVELIWKELRRDFTAASEFGNYQICVCGPSATYMTPDANWHGVGLGWTEDEAKSAAELDYQKKKTGV